MGSRLAEDVNTSLIDNLVQRSGSNFDFPVSEKYRCFFVYLQNTQALRFDDQHRIAHTIGEHLHDIIGLRRCDAEGCLHGASRINAADNKGAVPTNKI